MLLTNAASVQTPPIALSAFAAVRLPASSRPAAAHSVLTVAIFDADCLKVFSTMALPCPYS
jgi:hypothetical protein